MSQLGLRRNTGQAAKAVAAHKTFHFEEREKQTSRTRIRSYAQKQKTSENVTLAKVTEVVPRSEEENPCQGLGTLPVYVSPTRS
jgi:hypothetical protein